MPRWLVLVCCLGLPVPAGAATPRLLVHATPWYATRAAWKDLLDAIYAHDCVAAADILAGVQRDLAADEVGDGPDRPTGGAPATP